MKPPIFSALLGLALSAPAVANTYSVGTPASAGYLSSGYSIVGVTDINGDGTADIITKDASGNVYAGGTLITALPSGAYVVGAGYNNDTGHGILIVQDTSNNVVVLDPSAGRADSLGQMTSGYRIVGVGGAPAQGPLLIAWQNAAGDAHRWRLAAQPAYVVQPDNDSDWGTIGGSVFGFEYLNVNAKGPAFLAYSNLYHQQLATTSLGSTFSATAAPSGYSPVAIADFNGDGESDIVWFNPTTRDLKIGYTTTCGSLGTVPSITYASLGTVASGFSFSGFGDVNADGTLDLVFYNAGTYEVQVWPGSKSGSTACSNASFPAFSFNQGRP